MTNSAPFVTTLSGVYWRMKFLREAADILGPARAPEGRSHYNGQRAMYLSASWPGSVVATRIYVKPNDPPRGLFRIRVKAARVVDLRSNAATSYFKIDVTHRAADWQSIRAQGLPSPTWSISDRVRELDFDGMLYASRTDPTITHLTIFRWNEPGTAQLEEDGPPEPYVPDQSC
ncbi:MAG: RES family NAD+ phosphorylase [Paracoccaceae bacterium]